MQRKILIPVFLCCSLFAFAQKHKKKEKIKSVNIETPKMNYKQIGAPMPAIRMVTLKGVTITEQNLQSDANLFVMMFNPFCEHCEDETELLKKNIGLFKKSRLVLMAAPTMLSNLELFEQSHKINEYPTIVMGVDSSGFIDKTFIYESLPQINIYDKSRKLIKILSGDVPLDSLKRYIE